MKVNDLEIPSAYVEFAKRQEGRKGNCQFRLKQNRDSFGNEWDVELSFVMTSEIGLDTACYDYDEFDHELQGENGEIEYEYFYIICFGYSRNMEPFCFDFRDDQTKPSIIWLDGEKNIWRKVAGSFDDFIALFDQDSQKSYLENKSGYYVLTWKKQRGCPVGLLNSILYDKYYPRKEAHKIEHGCCYPWYTQKPKDYAFPKNGVFISKDRLYDFDICGAHADQYVVSKEFLALLKRFSASIKKIEGVSFVSQDNKPITTRDYFILVFEPEGKNAVDLEKTEISAEKQSYEDYKWEDKDLYKPVLREDFKRDFFYLAALEICHCSALVCSEAFMNEAKKMKVKGVDFVPIEDYAWRKTDASVSNYENYPILI